MLYRMGVRGRSGKKWSEFGYILIKEPVRFPKGLDIRYEHKNAANNDSTVFYRELGA